MCVGNVGLCKYKVISTTNHNTNYKVFNYELKKLTPLLTRLEKVNRVTALIISLIIYCAMIQAEER